MSSFKRGRPHREPNDAERLASPTLPVCQENWGNQMWPVSEVTATARPSVRHHEFDCCVRFYVRAVHVSVVVIHRGLFLGVKLFQISTWASGFDTKYSCFGFFYFFLFGKKEKINILFRNAHANILHWSDYPAVVELLAGGEGEKVDQQIGGV